MQPLDIETAAATGMRRWARPNTVEVDHGALTRNLSKVEAFVGTGAAIFAALKGNAYGFDLVPVAQTLCDAGVHGIAVADAQDALSLRSNGIGRPILLYGGSIISESMVGLAVDHDLILTVHHPSIASNIAQFALGNLSVFLKINVGLQRLGLDPDDIEPAIRALQQNPKVAIDGVYTHMFVPDEPDTAPAIGYQFRVFIEAVGVAKRLGVKAAYTMVASSAVLRHTDKMNLTAVDPGHLLYGFGHSGLETEIPVEPVLRAIRSRLISVRRIGDGDALLPLGLRPGWRIGVVPLGLRDGLPGFTAGHVLVNARTAPIIGPSSLEHTRVDLGDALDAQVGDEVVVLGEQGERKITIDDIMRTCGYGRAVELTMAISPDVPRIAVGR